MQQDAANLINNINPYPPHPYRALASFGRSSKPSLACRPVSPPGAVCVLNSSPDVLTLLSEALADPRSASASTVPAAPGIAPPTPFPVVHWFADFKSPGASGSAGSGRLALALSMSPAFWLSTMD